MQRPSILLPRHLEPNCGTPAGSSAHSVVSLREVDKDFYEAGRARKVLDNVTLSIDVGSFVVLLGHSGSGKSTLLNLISGIEQPTAGCIAVRDVSLSSLRDRERTLFRRDHIGFIFQFFNLIPTLTVLENVTLPQELAGRDVRAAALSLLEQVGLVDRQDAFPDKLSGGEQQRVAIARALVHDPMLVLADEPTGNLDELMGKRVIELLLGLTRDRGKSLIMATHNPQIAELADRVMIVHDGCVKDDSSRKW